MSVKKENMIKIKLLIKENIFKRIYLIGLCHFLMWNKEFLFKFSFLFT